MKKLAVGVDIGGMSTAFGLVDIEGKEYGDLKLAAELAIKVDEFPDKQYPTFDEFAEIFHSRVQQLIATVGEPVEIVGVGLGAPSANYKKGAIEKASNLKKWGDYVPVSEKLEKYFPGKPILVANDANAAAIGEMMYGAAKGMKDFIVVTLGTGVGSGFVIDGRLMTGHNSFAGELGHVIVDRDGRDCGCGRKGCLETYTSAIGIKRTVHQLLADRKSESVFRKMTYDQLESKVIYEQALKGDPIALEAFEVTGKYLGRAIADAAAITDPEAVILFGGLAKSGDLILKPTKKYMDESILFLYKDVKLLRSAIDDKNVAILGASALVWQSLC